jgi:hypothetical protein
MKLITQSQLHTLQQNGIRACQNAAFDPKPVVKLFTPDGPCTWLLAYLDPDENDIAFGLCDLGLGFAECGSVRLSEIRSVRGQLGLPVERDKFFKADYPLSVYARAASEGYFHGEAYITFDPLRLAKAAEELGQGGAS